MKGSMRPKLQTQHKKTWHHFEQPSNDRGRDGWMETVQASPSAPPQGPLTTTSFWGKKQALTVPATTRRAGQNAKQAVNNAVLSAQNRAAYGAPAQCIRYCSNIAWGTKHSLIACFKTKDIVRRCLVLAWLCQTPSLARLLPLAKPADQLFGSSEKKLVFLKLQFHSKSPENPCMNNEIIVCPHSLL